MRDVMNQIANLPLLNRSATARQFVKFSVVGVSNTAWDFALYLILTRGWLGFELHFLVANVVAFLGSVLNSYLLNKRWTFRNRDARHHVQFTKFFLVNCVSLALYEVLLYVFHQRVGLFDLVAKLLSVAVVMVWNFAANKYWTFREPSENLQKQT